ncbi:hypothetical protein ACFVXC_17140 [Streptomyces sp. NPDC058257]|uniref:hypothetical protein n=1 Tax=Streptomyces sp. NPDC058257 TaxID=3346409 RepID=UPI0036E50267
MASGLRDTVHGERRTAARCTVFGTSLATLLAVLCVCFGFSAHHDAPSDRVAVSCPAAPLPGAGAPASAAEASLGHSCPPGERCASATHAAAIALPAPEPSVPTTLGEAGLPAAPATALPVPPTPVHRYAPDLHVLQVLRT